MTLSNNTPFNPTDPKMNRQDKIWLVFVGILIAYFILRFIL